ncbi:MAG TPA: glycosyltransferase family A protein [Syntrophobacteraceae bacterium]|nr:glycosyltransferase family A protein [Syntrophobacteraceae bacterium]
MGSQMIDYVIITPVKDEEKFIEYTIKSVISQTVMPTEWIIVDDGSVDNTRKIIEAYSDGNPWIRPVYRNDRGARRPGLRHLKAFYDGYAKLEDSDWTFLVKLDGDLSFAEDYFEKCFGYFTENPRLGIGGGVILNVLQDRLVPEKHPLFHVRGATKIYRRQCWEAIGGIMMSPSYDTLDEIKANMLGYQTRSFPGLKVFHHRCTGKAYGRWGSAVKDGLCDYISGYHPLFMACKCVKRAIGEPFPVNALGLLYGYCSGYMNKVQRVPDASLIKYLRQQQLRCLMLRESIWR